MVWRSLGYSTPSSSSTCSSTSSSSNIGARSSLEGGEVGVGVSAALPGAALPRSGAALPLLGAGAALPRWSAALPPCLESAGVCYTCLSSTSAETCMLAAG